MADLSDISDLLLSIAGAAVYPNGTGSPSIASMDVRLYEGWPIAEQLDLDMAGQMMQGSPSVPVTRPGGPVANVSVYPLPGGSQAQQQIALDNTYVISSPVYGLTVTQVGNAVTVTGTPGAGEFLTLIADSAHVYSEAGSTAAALLGALLAAAQVDYPSATLSGSVLTVPANISLVVRQGGVGTLGKVVNRQKQLVMVTVWAPNRIARTLLSRAIDVAIKTNVKVTFPDTSEGLVIPQRTNQTDEGQNNSVYRRDLVYEVTYATVLEFPGVEITSVQTQVTAEMATNFNPPVETTIS